MHKKPERKNTDECQEKILLRKLTGLTKQVSLGHYAKAKAIFELTKTARYPQAITELAEAFGMMIVKVESREFKLEQLVEELAGSCRDLRAAKKSLESFNEALEKQVQNRTKQWQAKNVELTKTLSRLKQEIKDRERAEKNLQALYQQLGEANQKLLDAYLWMRQSKDRLEARQFTESVVFLVDFEGKINGVTDNAIEITGKSRAELVHSPLEDILEPQDGSTVRTVLQQVRPKMAYNTKFILKNGPKGGPLYEGKLTRVAVEGKRLITLDLYESAGT